VIAVDEEEPGPEVTNGQSTADLEREVLGVDGTGGVGEKLPESGDDSAIMEDASDHPLGGAKGVGELPADH